MCANSACPPYVLLHSDRFCVFTASKTGHARCVRHAQLRISATKEGCATRAARRSAKLNTGTKLPRIRCLAFWGNRSYISESEIDVVSYFWFRQLHQVACLSPLLFTGPSADVDYEPEDLQSGGLEKMYEILYSAPERPLVALERGGRGWLRKW